MSVITRSTHRASEITTADAQRVEDTLTLISPKWSTWVLQTLAQHGPMRVRDASAALPFVSEQLVRLRLARLESDGLVSRSPDRSALMYQLTDRATQLKPLQDALGVWGHEHFPEGRPVAQAERIESAVKRLHLRHTTSVIQLLDTNGPMRFMHIAEEAELDTASTQFRLSRLQLDGLVTRHGTRHGDPYTLTEAARALGPVYQAADRWKRGAAPAAPVAHVPRAQPPARPDPNTSRTAAALRRTPLAHTGLFSHASTAPAPVPVAVTALSAPSRAR